MFQNTAIRTLLAWGFGIVIVLIVATAGVVSRGADTVEGHVTAVIGDSYPKVAAATDIQLNVMRNWSNSLLLLQIDNADESKRITEEMAANSKTITTRFEFLDKSVESEAGKQTLDAMRKARTDYTEERKRYIGMVKAGNRDEANRLLTGVVKNKLDRFHDGSFASS